MEKLITIEHIGKHGQIEFFKDEGGLGKDYFGVFYEGDRYELSAFRSEIRRLDSWSEGEENFFDEIVKFITENQRFISLELKPCPFCGEIPEVIFDEEGSSYEIYCKDGCGCKLGNFDDRDDAIAVWNSRRRG